MNMLFTVALCTHNHADRLTRTLADLAQLRAPDSAWEFVVIDNASTDETPAILANHTWPEGWQARIVREEKLGLSNARNRAIQEARGEYLIFMDDDETADADWLRAFERLVEQHSPDAFGGQIDVLFEDMRPPWLADELLGFLGELHRSDTIVPLTEPDAYFHGGNFGFKTAVCKTVGGFDAMLGRKGADNTGGEEMDFYRRLLSAGFKVWWTPEAVIYHRIQAAKLQRSYFLDLHYRAGKAEAIRRRGDGARIPPNYLYGQLVRSAITAWRNRRNQGSDHSLRREMNVAYFAGLVIGWIFGPRKDAA